jgi:hypothetical protein
MEQIDLVKKNFLEADVYTKAFGSAFLPRKLARAISLENWGFVRDWALARVSKSNSQNLLGIIQGKRIGFPTLCRDDLDEFAAGLLAPQGCSWRNRLLRNQRPKPIQSTSVLAPIAPLEKAPSDFSYLDMPSIAQYLGISEKQAIGIVRKLFEGQTVALAFNNFEIPSRRRKGLMLHIGWTCTWRRLPLNGCSSDFVGSLSKADAIALFKQGNSLVAIGAIAGVSRERIRQIVLVAGLPSRRVMIQAKKQEEKQQRIQRRQERLEKIEIAKKVRWENLAKRFQKANEMWHANFTTSQIAKECRVSTNSMSWYANILRYKLGPGWFPLRACTWRPTKSQTEQG